MLRAEKAKGRRIYLVSDFYLDQQSIVYFAKCHGFDDIFDGFFVSSENKRTKKEGRAYDVVIARLGLNVKRRLCWATMHTVMLLCRQPGAVCASFACGSTPI